MLEEAREDIMIQKQEWKTSFFCLCIVNLGTITGFSDELNKTLNKLNKTLKAQF